MPREPQMSQLFVNSLEWKLLLAFLFRNNYTVFVPNVYNDGSCENGDSQIHVHFSINFRNSLPVKMSGTVIVGSQKAGTSFEVTPAPFLGNIDEVSEIYFAALYVQKMIIHILTPNNTTCIYV